ncbi:MAG: DNA mismatch repair endonuclease MutL [Hungatella sp.]|nr:DNA mismatch repair endonuclease MutL [Hungatella sp.]
MARIVVLDQNTINKIAAGEVIERPASVVKELLENAIDAQATAVTVEIRDGGISFIRVTDNGSGIPKDEVSLAFLRHSTSKIKSVEDLFTVASLGFRGEALSSIAAVAQVELITKTPEQLSGIRYQIEGGKERLLEEIGAPDGTTFIVRNLFYNTPVRQKFLKTAQTEGSHVAALVEKLAMSHPDISIRFIQNNQNKLYTSGNHNLKDIIYTIFGREIAANLLRVEWQEEILQIRGFAGKPVIARNNRNFENYYINGRYIKSSLVAKAIEEAYKPFMMQHKYPFVLLHLTIEPEYLDVNVHPTKMELRFRDEERIFRIIYQAVSDSLAQKELVPQVSLNKDRKEKQEKNIRQQHHPEPFEVKRLNYYESEQKEKRQTKANEVKAENPQEKDIPEFGNLKTEQKEFKNLKEITKSVKAPTMAPSQETEENRRSESQIQEEKKETYIIIPSSQTVAEEKGSWNGKARTTSSNTLEQLNFFEEKLLEPKNRFHHKLIGQLFDTYWLVEFNDQLYIIDQHAAHEKVLYEKTMKTLRTREYTSQMLNPPIILTLGSEEQMILEKYRSYFTEIGFEIEHFGGNEYAVRGIPDNLFSIAKKELLMEMIDSLTDDIFKGSPDIIYERVASMSCKAAVKGNHHISFAEADHLIDQLLELENPYTCPHGRPTIISMSKHELERKFKRIV